MWQAFVTGVLGIVAVATGVIIGGRITEKQTAARSKAERDQAREDADRADRRDLYLEVSMWAGACRRWATRVGDGWDVPFPFADGDRDRELLMARVRITPTVSQEVRDRVDELHWAVIDTREATDGKYHRGTPPLGGPIEVTIEAGSPSHRVLELVDELQDLLREELGR